MNSIKTNYKIDYNFERHILIMQISYDVTVCEYPKVYDQALTMLVLNLRYTGIADNFPHNSTRK